MAEVLRFEPKVVGDGYRFDPNVILDEAKDRGFTSVVVIGEMEDGSTWVSSAANAGEALILMERAKKLVVFGES